MGQAKKELMEQEQKNQRKEQCLVDKGVYKRCSQCETAFEPEQGNDFLCPYCEEKYEKQ